MVVLGSPELVEGAFAAAEAARPRLALAVIVLAAGPWIATVLPALR